MMEYIERDIDEYISEFYTLTDSTEQEVRQNFIICSDILSSLKNIIETYNDDKTSKYRNRINKFMVKNNIKILLLNIKPSDIEQLEKYCSQIQVVKPDENLERWLNRKK